MVTLRQVHRLMRQATGRVRGMIRRAALGTLDVSGQGYTLQAKTTADDADDGVEFFQQYGFHSGPPAGSEGVVLRVGGERAHSIAIAFGLRTAAPGDLEQGEVALYHLNGTVLALRNDTSVELTTPQGATITITPTGAIDVTPAPGQTVNLGPGEPSLPVARAGDPVAVTVSALATLQTALAGWVVAPQDGGAALKTALAPFLELEPGPVVAGTGTITAGGTGSTST